MKGSIHNVETDSEFQKEFNPFRTPYDVDEHAFPWYGGLQEQFTFLLRYAVLAPSSYNTQPWKFGLSNEGIAVYADYSRRLPVVDPGNRELVIGVGAALTNLRIAAEHFGFKCSVEYNRSEDNKLPLAFVYLSPPRSLFPEESRPSYLFQAIAERHTNRNPFLMARVPEQIVASLTELAVSGSASIFTSRDGTLNQQVADLVAEADRTRLAEGAFRKELAEWIRPNYARRPDGVTGASLGISDLVSVVNPWAMKTFDLGRLRAAKDRNLCLEAPGVVVIYSEDSLLHWIEVGELLQRVLLTLTKNSVQFSFFNMLTGVPSLRTRLRALLGISSWPQVLLRIGYCLTEPVLSPRRPVDEVIFDTTLLSAVKGWKADRINEVTQ